MDDRLNYWTAIAQRPRHAVRARFIDLPNAPCTLADVNRLYEVGVLLKAQCQTPDGMSVVVVKWSAKHKATCRLIDERRKRGQPQNWQTLPLPYLTTEELEHIDGRS